MEKEIAFNIQQKVQIAGALILLLCIFPFPYGFYTIVRVTTTIICGYLAFTYYNQNKKELAIFFTIIAVLFQPMIKFTLGREMWLVVDIIVAIVLLTLSFKGFFKNNLTVVNKNIVKSPILSECDIEKVKEFALSNWELGETHGLSHWERVERNGILLSTKNGYIRSDVNIKVVRYFAYLHDKCRFDNWTDIEHGIRAAEMLHTIRDTILKDFTDEEVSLLEKACKYHTTEHRTGNPTIDICFDADRLDLGRVGIIPDPNKMATDIGAYYAKNIHLINN